MTLATITTYQWFLAVHILAAVLWVGGAFAVQAFAMRAVRANDGPYLGKLTSEIEWVGTRVFVPSSLVLVVFGFLLIHHQHYDYKFWLVFPIAIWAISFVTGAAFLGPESGRISRAIERHGVDSAEAQMRIKRIFLVSRVELLLLLLVVADMVLKPFS
ncbi:MAG TPA: DUF2269 family protein [Conexibacter sp.]|nr:DUF2269 family protein [Conexibacter sp.]